MEEPEKKTSGSIEKHIVRVLGFSCFLRYQIMLKCWQESPMQRPTFEELVKEFDAMLVSLPDKVDSTRRLEEVYILLLLAITTNIFTNSSLKSATKVSEVDMSVGENWEIDRELINLQEVLGEGAFGRVMKAEMFGIPNMPFRCHVAVKMIKGEFWI